MNFKMLRNELARDPGISFTSLFPTINNRFNVQGNRGDVDRKLESGFPVEVKILDKFDCLIIGSIPAKDWSRAQEKVLLEFIKQGGAVIFLGGEHSFDSGSYATTPIAPLFPWQLIGKRYELLRGKFPVSVPAATVGNPMMAGINKIFRQEGPVVGSINIHGRLKPGSQSLVNAEVNGRQLSLIAIQSFGKGKVVGIATNMLWKWATTSNKMRQAYELFWRQTVRNITDDNSAGKDISIKWDRKFYRPGEQAVGEISVGGENAEGIRLSASRTFNKDKIPLPVEQIAGVKNKYSVVIPFKERGEYLFRLVAYQGNQGSESYEKTFLVSALLHEGANLELDEQYLKQTAEKGSGLYINEKRINMLIKVLQEKMAHKTMLIETSLIHSKPFFLILILLLLITEWLLRRQQNLI